MNQTWYGLAPLHIACSKGNLAVLKSLVECGASIFKGIPLEAYYLFLNLKSDPAKMSTATFSLPPYRSQWKPNTNNIDSSRQQQKRMPTDIGASSTLHEQSIQGYQEYVKQRRVYAVEIAAMAGHHEAARYLLQKYDAKQASSLTCCFHPHLDFDICILFLRAGASPENCVDPWGSNAFHLAARAGRLGLVVAMHAYTPRLDIHKKGRNGWYVI